jgi:hypothetical protein
MVLPRFCLQARAFTALPLSSYGSTARVLPYDLSSGTTTRVLPYNSSFCSGPKLAMQRSQTSRMMSIATCVIKRKGRRACSQGKQFQIDHRRDRK